MLNIEPSQSLGFVLTDVTRLLRREFNRRAEPLGLTQAQWRTLMQLSHNEGINQVTLAEILEIQPITLARLIDKLQDAGLVERRADPTDRRAFCLYLDGKAQPVLQELRALSATLQDEVLAGVAAPARAQLLKMLAAMRENLLGIDVPTGRCKESA